MAMKFVQIPEDTFKDLQLEAGVILKSFDPSSPTIANENIVCATTGGINVTAVPSITDLGEDIDNCPNNMIELAHVDSWECTMGFTSLSINEAMIKLALLDVDKDTSSGMMTPKSNVTMKDGGSIWWVGDLADGRFVAVELKHVANTAGLSLQTTKKGKGQMSYTLTGHYSLEAQDETPIGFYLSAAA